LKNTPEFSLFKVFVFFLPSHDFLFKGDLRVLENGVYFVGSRTEAVEYSGFHFYWTDNILSRPLLYLILKLFFFLLEQDFTSIGVLLEQICILALFVEQHNTSSILSDLLILFFNDFHEAVSMVVGGGVAH